MTTSLVHDSRSKFIDRTSIEQLSSASEQELSAPSSENFPRHPLFDQQSAFAYFHQMSAVPFKPSPYLAQQSLISQWAFPPSFFSAWPHLMQMSPIIPNSEFTLPNNNYLRTEFDERVQVKMSSLSPVSRSESPHDASITKPTKPTTGKKKEFKCNLCTKVFGYKHVLQNHEKVHSGEKPFRCEKCNKRFRRDHHLKVHMRLHSGEKPFSCSFPNCERQFVQVANLRRHLKTHEHGILRIHEKMLTSSEAKENISSSNSESNSRISPEHEDYENAYKTSLNFSYESPEQSEPEDLSIKSTSRTPRNL